jgi:hypothetical protein
MVDFPTQRGRVIEGELQKAPRAIATLLIGVFVFIVLWASIARVPTGHVGVLISSDV